MTFTDELLKNADSYAASFDKGSLSRPPAKQVAIVTCMDARLNPYSLLGLGEGDAHIIRNAGGVVTHDQLRSLAISQRLLGTKEIVLIQHTDCGLLTMNDDEFQAQIVADTGIRPAWVAEAFDDLDASIRKSIARIEAEPSIPVKESVRGFVYDVSTGELREIV